MLNYNLKLTEEEKEVIKKLAKAIEEQEEEWRSLDFLGLPDYAVSNQGRVKSFKRKEEHIMATSLVSSSDLKHCYQSLPIVIDGRQVLFYVHRLVSRAFPEICGEWEEGKQTHHKDGDKMNNKAENLILVWPKEHKALHKEMKKK